jgi:hypothetical protein
VSKNSKDLKIAELASSTLVTSVGHGSENLTESSREYGLAWVAPSSRSKVAEESASPTSNGSSLEQPVSKAIANSATTVEFFLTKRD